MSVVTGAAAKLGQPIRPIDLRTATMALAIAANGGKMPTGTRPKLGSGVPGLIAGVVTFFITLVTLWRLM